jgi:hypothetical protein
LSRSRHALRLDRAETVRDPKVRTAIGQLFDRVPAVLGNPDEPLNEKDLQALGFVVQRVAALSPQARRTLAGTAAAVIPELAGKSWNEAADIVSAIPPNGSRSKRTTMN